MIFSFSCLCFVSDGCCCKSCLPCAAQQRQQQPAAAAAAPHTLVVARRPPCEWTAQSVIIHSGGLVVLCGGALTSPRGIALLAGCGVVAECAECLLLPAALLSISCVCLAACVHSACVHSACCACVCLVVGLVPLRGPGLWVSTPCTSGVVVCVVCMHAVCVCVYVCQQQCQSIVGWSKRLHDLWLGQHSNTAARCALRAVAWSAWCVYVHVCTSLHNACS